MNTARAEDAFVVMFNTIEENDKPKNTCVRGLRNCIVSICNMEIDLKYDM
jgi:hypothetical protein